MKKVGVESTVRVLDELRRTHDIRAYKTEEKNAKSGDGNNMQKTVQAKGGEGGRSEGGSR